MVRPGRGESVSRPAARRAAEARTGAGPAMSEAAADEAVRHSDVARHVARAAARLFAERGYDATSVREIVEAAGVTKPTLYYYFASKEGLAQELLIRPLRRLVAELDALARGPEEPRAAITAMLAAKFAFCRDDPDRARFVYALFFGPLGSGLAVEMAQIGEAMDALWLAAARRLAAAGLIPPARVDDCVAMLRGLIVVTTVDFLYRDAAIGPDRPARLVEAVLRGLGTETARG
jgi:TetR/AcrR family transcriptional regulator